MLQELDWTAIAAAAGAESSTAAALPVADILLGSDVFYDPSVFEPLLRTLRRLFDRSPHAQFYFAYQIRE